MLTKPASTGQPQFSPKSLLLLSTLSFLLYEQRKARKAHNTDVKSIFFRDASS
jgi:hypothetical protein